MLTKYAMPWFRMVFGVERNRWGRVVSYAQFMRQYLQVRHQARRGMHSIDHFPLASPPDRRLQPGIIRHLTGSAYYTSSSQACPLLQGSLFKEFDVVITDLFLLQSTANRNLMHL